MLETKLTLSPLETGSVDRAALRKAKWIIHATSFRQAYSVMSGIQHRLTRDTTIEPRRCTQVVDNDGSDVARVRKIPGGELV